VFFFFSFLIYFCFFSLFQAVPRRRGSAETFAAAWRRWAQQDPTTVPGR
jgi:hypothetical protein